jgi:PAS domain S-box-containing protein
VQVSDIYRDGAGRIRLDFVVPLINREDGAQRVVGVAVLRAPAEKFLFPLIQTWPTPSPSGETLLFRRDANSVLFLNELRHRGGAALSFRLPLDTPELPAAIALRDGRTGNIEGRDYRGVPVLTTVRRVPDTSWFLVAKVDRDEVLRPLHDLVFWIGLVALAAVAAVAAAVFLLWRQEQHAHRLALIAQAAEKDRLLKLFYDLPFIGMAITSPENRRWLHANDRLCEMLGYPREELLQTTWEDLTHPDDLAAERVRFDEVLNGASEGYALDKRFVRKDGSLVETSLDVKCVRRAGQGVEYLVATVQDITERKRVGKALRDSEMDLNRAQAVGQIGSWRLDVRHNELLWSDENHRIFGIPRGTPLTYETFLSTVHPDDREYVDRMWKAALHGEPYDIEHRLIADGGLKWVRERAELEFDEQGMLLGGFGTTQDITERKQAEEKLRLQLRLTNAITDCAADSIFVTDEYGRTTFANAEAEQVFGYTAAEFMGQVLHDLIHHHHPDGRPYPFVDCPNCWIYLSGETVRNEEAVFFRKDGTPVMVACSNSPLEVGGERMGAILVAHDITSLKHAEEALREADRRKDEFVAMLAHELRNPLAPIRSAAHVLGHPGLDASRIEWARKIIEGQVVHLTRLVDDLLDVSRIVRGNIEPRREPIELAAVVEQALESARPLIESKGHAVTVSLPQAPVQLEGDPVRLTQVLLNLLDNAAKFTPRGGKIELRAERVGPEVELAVRDNGIGIPAELLPRIFDLFEQGERTLDRTEGGLGIGLTLVHRLVELHGGRVQAKSAGPGQGAEFTVWLPAAVAREDQGGEKPRPAPRRPGRRILLVEDEVHVADAMGMLLSLEGHQVKVASTGQAALEIAAAFRPEAVLLDIGLKGMDGYEVARRLRELPEAREALLVAVTGYGHEEARAHSLTAGFDHHLVKPVDPERLLDLLAGFGTRPDEGQAGTNR